MAEGQTNGSGAGDNSLAATNQAIVDAFGRMDGLEAQRKALNDKIKAERKDLYAHHGVTPTALARSRALWKMDEKQRALEQAAQAVCENAIGIWRRDLFENLEPLPTPEQKKRGRPSKDAAAAQEPASA